MYIYYVFIFISFLVYLLLNQKYRVKMTNQYEIDFVQNSYRKELKKKKAFIIMVSILLLLIISFRDISVGTDSYAYLKDYQINYNILPFSSFIEFIKEENGFRIILLILHRLGINWRGFQILYAALVTISLGLFCYKYSDNLFITYLLYVTIGTFAMSLTGIRQTIAIALVLFIYNLLDNKKYVPALLLYVVASSTHYTALFMIILFFLELLIKNKKRNFSFWIFIGIIIPILSYFFTKKILDIFSFLLLDKYKYSGYYTTLNSTLNPVVIIMYSILFLYILTGIILSKNKLTDKDIKFFILSSFFIGCYLASGTVYMLARLSYYFSPFFIVLLTNNINNFYLNKRSKIVIELLLCLICLIAFTISIPGSSYGIDNYHFSISSYS